MKTKNEKGVLILKQISFEDCISRNVIKNNHTSGKINLPKNWIGKKVYVILESKNGN